MAKKQKDSTKTTKQGIAQVILLTLSILAILAGVGALADLSDANSAQVVIETWRMIGFFTFAALFSLLANKMQDNRDLWVIVIANKLALTVAGFIYLSRDSVAGAQDLAFFDGGITVALISASYLAGVWNKSAK